MCVVTFGGGLVAGDDIDLELSVEPDATLLVFTQASTKVFRGSSRQRIRAHVEGTLVLLPDPVAAFAGARYTQRVEIELAGRGACVLLDGFTSGRSAFGERWAMSELDLRTTVAAGGAAVVSDALRLDAADGSVAERAGSFEAFASLIALGHAVEPVVRCVRDDAVAPPSDDVMVAASPLPRAGALGLPGAIVRACSRRPSGALAAVRQRLRNLPDIGIVDPFARRY